MKKNNILLFTHNMSWPFALNIRDDITAVKVMELKLTNDNRDKYMWRCRKVHTVVKEDKTYKCKDVKLSIRHNSWLRRFKT